MDGFTSREASEILGVADGTLKSHLHRALGKLRAELADLANHANHANEPGDSHDGADEAPKEHRP